MPEANGSSSSRSSGFTASTAVSAALYVWPRDSFPHLHVNQRPKIEAPQQLQHARLNRSFILPIETQHHPNVP
jgi:hypothetical protein